MVISLVNPVPPTVKVCVAEALPKQVLKVFKVPVTVSTGSTTVFEELVTRGFIVVLSFWVLAKSKLVQKIKDNNRNL